MEEKEKKENKGRVFLGLDALSWVDMLLSFVSFLLAYFGHLIIAFGNYIDVGLSLVLFFSIFIFLTKKRAYKNKQEERYKNQVVWAKYICIFTSVFLFLTIGAQLFDNFRKRFPSKNEMIADCTTGVVDMIIKVKHGQGGVVEYWENIGEVVRNGWVRDAILNDQVVLALIERNEDIGQFVVDSYNPDKVVVKKVKRDEYRVTGHYFSIGTGWYDKIPAQGNKTLLFLYKPDLREDWNGEGCEVLPEHVTSTLKGAYLQDEFNWDESLPLLLKADTLGNAGASFLLAQRYERGCGQEPDFDNKRKYYLKKAADGGSRIARVLWADDVLMDRSVGRLQKAEAMELLNRVSYMNTVATPEAVDCAQGALEILSLYYSVQGKYRKAYKAARESFDIFKNPEVHYTLLLNSCINCGDYDAAKKIIKQGKRVRHPNCYVAQAFMLSKGLGGYKKNVKAAEEQLLFAADSLGYSEAYRVLADLYEQEGAPERDVEFWRKLCEVKFNAKER